MLTRKEASTPRRIDLRLVYHLCFASLGVEDYLCCELLKHVVAVHYSALDLTRRSVHNCLMCVTRATAYWCSPGHKYKYVVLVVVRCIWQGGQGRAGMCPASIIPPTMTMALPCWQDSTRYSHIWHQEMFLMAFPWVPFSVTLASSLDDCQKYPLWPILKIIHTFFHMSIDMLPAKLVNVFIFFSSSPKRKNVSTIIFGIV